MICVRLGGSVAQIAGILVEAASGPHTGWMFVRLEKIHRPLSFMSFESLIP